MNANFRKSLAFASLATSACFLAALTGCSSSSTPATPAATAAKNMYVIQSTQVDSVENDSILTFAVASSGASTPASTLTLPAGYYAYSVAVGPTGKIYVGAEYAEDPSEIMVFAAGASGAATPITVYTGGTPGSFDYADYMAVNDQGQLFVMSDDESIEVYSADATGGDLPAQYITTYATNDDFSSGIGADHAGNIYLTSERNQNINVFAAGAAGNATPTTITGTTGNAFTVLGGITADSAGDIIVANYNAADDPFQESRHASVRKIPHLRHDLQSHFHHTGLTPQNNTSLPPAPTAIYIFSAGATGVATPARTISGSATTVNEPEDLATDAVGNIYYGDFEGGAPTLMVFAPTATGNVAPKNSMTSTAYTSSWAFELTAY